ncbi:hypothetical protein ACHWUR_02325 [Klebsiella pneumoniae]
MRGSHPGGTAAVCRASAGEAVAQLWQAPQGLVVPGSYRQFTGSAGGQRAFCRARLAGMASPLRRRSGAPGAGHYQP